MIQRLNNAPDHDPALNNDSGQDSGDNFPNETQIMNIIQPQAKFSECDWL